MLVCFKFYVIWIYIYPTTLTPDSIILLLLLYHFKICMDHSVGVAFHTLMYRVPRDISTPAWRWGNMYIYLYWVYRPRYLTYCLWVAYIFLPLVIVDMMYFFEVMFWGVVPIVPRLMLNQYLLIALALFMIVLGILEWLLFS